MGFWSISEDTENEYCRHVIGLTVGATEATPTALRSYSLLISLSGEKGSERGKTPDR